QYVFIAILSITLSSGAGMPAEAQDTEFNTLLFLAATLRSQTESPEFREASEEDMRRLIRNVVLVATATVAVSTGSQTPSAKKPQFEVASVKPTNRRGGMIPQPGGRFIAVGQSLRILIAYAYRFGDFQIIGGPAWMDTDMWEIQAKA